MRPVSRHKEHHMKGMTRRDSHRQARQGPPGPHCGPQAQGTVNPHCSGRPSVVLVTAPETQTASRQGPALPVQGWLLLSHQVAFLLGCPVSSSLHTQGIMKKVPCWGDTGGQADVPP